jgi:hypothetical protein
MKKIYVLAIGALAVGVSLAVLNGVGMGMPQGQLKSGPQVGEMVPGPFHPLNCNGEFAGKKQCLYCINGTNPVAMIFARESTPQVTKLIKKIDAATAKNKDAEMGSFVVFLNDKEGLDKQLTDLAKAENLQQTILAVDNAAGPEGYNVAQDASVTVVLYRKHTVIVNQSFRSPGDLTDTVIDGIVGDVSKIVK